MSNVEPEVVPEDGGDLVVVPEPAVEVAEEPKVKAKPGPKPKKDEVPDFTHWVVHEECDGAGCGKCYQGLVAP